MVDGFLLNGEITIFSNHGKIKYLPYQISLLSLSVFCCRTHLFRYFYYVYERLFINYMQIY
ncbi:hypothetical protein CCP3SC1AL1_300013 [Gammaproteobacteria bacterium]